MRAVEDARRSRGIPKERRGGRSGASRVAAVIARGGCSGVPAPATIIRQVVAIEPNPQEVIVPVLGRDSPYGIVKLFENTCGSVDVSGLCGGT